MTLNGLSASAPYNLSLCFTHNNAISAAFPFLDHKSWFFFPIRLVRYFFQWSWWCFVNKLPKMILNTQKANLRNNHFLFLLHRRQQSNIKRNQKFAVQGVGVRFWMKRETGNFEVYRTIIISSNHHHHHLWICCKTFVGGGKLLNISIYFPAWESTAEVQHVLQ